MDVQELNASAVLLQNDIFYLSITEADGLKTKPRTFTETTAALGQVQMAIRVASGDNVNFTVRLREFQFEAGDTATSWQNNQSASDVTETGRRSVYYLRDDLVDDALPHTLEAGTYTVARMGRTGYIFTENVVHAGGAFDLLSGTGRDYAVLLHNQAGGLLSAAEKSVLQSVFEYAGEGATV
jgi:hypothetical protein